MNTVTKLVAYVVVLVLAGAAGLGVGAAVGPVGPVVREGHAEPDHAEPDHSRATHTPAEPAANVSEIPGGLMISQDGFTLDLHAQSLPSGSEVPLRFRILGPDGEAVTEYERSHGKALHLIAVRRDMVGYQHVHPTLDDDGTWRVPLDLSRPGEYRVFADFVPQGHGDSLTLGADLSVAGEYDPQPLPAPSRTAKVDGYTVRLDGRLRAGQESELTLSVSRNGEPVTDLQPYLGAYGHLVALRDGDLAYLHVHPAGHGDSTGHGTHAGPEITFFATTPSDGAYRLFLDFRHDDAVRTAEFTAVAGTENAR